MHLLELRNKHPVFTYKSYEIKGSSFTYEFTLGDIVFKPSWCFSDNVSFAGCDRHIIENLVFNIGMAELVSYWKCAMPPVVEIKCGLLNNEQAVWWKKLYFKGLGEFFYRNNIEASVDNFMDIKSFTQNIPPVLSGHNGLNGCLIPVGGGKDSVVTLELLRDSADDNLCFMINPSGAAVDCAKTAGYDDSKIVTAKRTIDGELLRLNKEGYLNGHTPFSAIVAFSSYFVAYICGKKYITLSNESSANESNVTGSDVNHQYSKSTEFEVDFRYYAEKYLGSAEYFSLLRPWSEWQITKRFTSYPQYFSIFKSCNLGAKQNIWCENCAKCLYVYIMLSAFLTDDQLDLIFKTNMLDDAEFLPMFKGLISDAFDKPFECVGTRREVNLALHNAVELRSDLHSGLPVILREYQKMQIPKPLGLDDYYDNNNYIPYEFLHYLNI